MLAGVILIINIYQIRFLVNNTLSSDVSIDSADLENNENKNISLNNNSIEDNPISECAVCFEQFGSTNDVGKLITRSCIIPCGHAQSCSSCLEKMKACPICKRQIHNYLRAYI